MSRTSSGVSCITNIPRLGSSRTSPSAERSLNASRTGPRLTSSWEAIRASIKRSPPRSSPDAIRSRRTSAACCASVDGGKGFSVTIASVANREAIGRAGPWQQLRHPSKPVYVQRGRSIGPISGCKQSLTVGRDRGQTSPPYHRARSALHQSDRLLDRNLPEAPIDVDATGLAISAKAVEPQQGDGDHDEGSQVTEREVHG